jgi:predicted DNA-binding protein
MDKDNKSVMVNLRITEELKKRLLILADQDQRTLSDFIRLQLEKLVKPNHI